MIELFLITILLLFWTSNNATIKSQSFFWCYTCLKSPIFSGARGSGLGTGRVRHHVHHRQHHGSLASRNIRQVRTRCFGNPSLVTLMVESWFPQTQGAYLFAEPTWLNLHETKSSLTSRISNGKEVFLFIPKLYFTNSHPSPQINNKVKYTDVDA